MIRPLAALALALLAASASPASAADIPKAGDRVDRNLPLSTAERRLVPPVPEKALKVEETRIDVRIGVVEYELEAIVVTPPGRGPFPLAVVSHGNPRDAKARRTTRIRYMLPVAEDFARRGYKAVVFARRGFGQSSGEFVEGNGSCKEANAALFTRGGRVSAEDFKAVIAALAADPTVDAGRVVAAGQSGGGFAVTALAADPPRGLIAVVSLSGGRGSPEDYKNCNEAGLTGAFAEYGKTARVPALWLYADTDKYFWPEFVGRNFAAYTAHGAPARLEMVGPLWFDDDGHMLAHLGGRAMWRPRIDAFLAAVGAPGWTQDPGDAAVGNPPPPDGLGDTGRQAWLKYLGRVGHKAFAVGAGGRYAYSTMQSDLDQAKARAMEICAENGKGCRVVSTDGGPAGR